MWQHKVVLLLLGLSLGSGVRAQNVCEGTFGSRLVANPTNCAGYHVCLNGAFVQDLTCGSGLHFDEMRQTCNVPDRVDCPANICAGNIPPGEVRLVGSNNDCSRFFVCPRTGAQPITSSCGFNNVFVEAQQQCALGETTTCPIQPQPQPDPPTIWSAWCPPTGVRLIPNPSSCEWYFLCNGGMATVFSCPPGHSFDVQSSQCTTTGAATCVGTVQPNCPPQGVHNVPHPHSCNSFFICSNGNPLMQQNCANTLIFDTNDNQCRPQETATCNVFG